ncbi:MAG: peptidylprolyl isomerase [Oscillospiraceae bacterium]|nr:peptidylprolyl isomerase [Oscillospiraceae bacterium]
MSASREKKNRQQLTQSGYVDPKVIREQEKKAQERKNNRMYAIGAIVFAIVAVVVLTLNSGIIQRGSTAVTIDGKEYKVNDVAFYFGNFYNQHANELVATGLDTSKDLREQEAFSGETWFDYFLGHALDEMTGEVKIAEAAEAEGFDATEEMDAAEENELAMMEMYGSFYGYTRDQYIRMMYGPYMTEKDFAKCVRRAALADAYTAAFEESQSYDEATLSAEYEANTDAYDSVDVEYILFDSDLTSEDPAEEKATALAEMTEKANEAKARYEAGEALETIADELDGYYAHTPYAAQNVTSDLLTWAFEAERKAGDVAVLDFGETGSYLAVFHGRSRNDYHTVSVRHILVEDQATAEDLLKQFTEGEATEADFAALAELNSEDPGSVDNGGLYEDIYMGQMVEPFQNWCFDASRQSGDTGIVESTNGFHVMYFVERNPMPYWQFEAKQNLSEEASEEWLSGIIADAAVEQQDGIKYVG